MSNPSPVWARIYHKQPDNIKTERTIEDGDASYVRDFTTVAHITERSERPARALCGAYTSGNVETSEIGVCGICVKRAMRIGWLEDWGDNDD